MFIEEETRKQREETRHKEYSEVVYKVLTLVTDPSYWHMSCWFPSLTPIWKKHQHPHYQQEHDPLISCCSLSQSRLPSPKLTVASHFPWCKNVV